MIDKGMLYRTNFSVGGRDGPASGNSGNTGGGGDGRDKGMGMAGKTGDYSSGPTGNTGGNDFTQYTKDVINPNIDFVGNTVFGPTQKYTGSFLDNLFNRGYRNIDPITGDFQSRFSQAGGFGKSIFGGILGLLNPLAGMAYKIGTSLPSLKNYDNLADYARGEFGLFSKAPGGFNIDKGRGSGLRSLGITEAVPPGMDLNDYDGYRDREYIESAPVNNGILDIIDYTDPYQGGTYN